MEDLRIIDSSSYFNRIEILDQIQCNEQNIVLYGAGYLGKIVLHTLKQINIAPVAFFADTIGSGQQNVEGIPVYDPREAATSLGNNLLVIVCICNAKHRFIDTQSRLEILGFLNILSFSSLIKGFPDIFAPYYVFAENKIITNQLNEINTSYQLLSDDISKENFIAHCNFRLSNNFNYLPLPESDLYFPEFLRNLVTENTHFIDCGAYTGDTLALFEMQYKIKFNHITAFEPDPKNFKAIQEFIALSTAFKNRDIKVYNKAITSTSGMVTFASTGTEGAQISDSGSTEIEGVSLSSFINSDNCFVKFDIEGAEQDALRGAGQELAKYKPILAVSAYHKPEDFWEIPKLIHEINSEYKISLRTEGEDGMGIVYYAY